MQTFLSNKYCIALIYLLVSSIIPVDSWFLGNTVLHNVFFMLKWGMFFILIIDYFRRHLYFKNRVFTIILLFCFAIFVSTAINGGSFRKSFSLIYTTFSLCSFIILTTRSAGQLRQFVTAISSLYFLLAVINLILIILLPSLFSSREYFGVYLLGGENHVIYPLMMGLFYILLGNKIGIVSTARVYLYIALFWVTVLYIWSGTSLIGSVVLFAILFIKPLASGIRRIPLLYLFLLVLCAISVIVLISVGGNNESEFSKYIVENIIGKDLTFSGRVYVWENVISEISQRPLLGHGLSETRNLFAYYNSSGEIWSPDLSAHNEFLAIMHEGGLVALLIVVLVIAKLGRCLNTSSSINLLAKAFIVSVTFLYLAEAPSLSALFELSTFTYMYVKVFNCHKQYL